MNGWYSLGFKSYQEYLESDIWISKREVFFKKYPRCAKCGKLANIVHHLNYNRLPQEKEQDLISLCHKCHKEIHNGR